LRARIFCTPCNTHFKHLEDAVIPLVVPMAKSQVFSLGAEHRELLALWATKTAAAPLATTAPELRDAMPLDHRDSIRHEGRPPRDAWVGWFPWNGRPVVAGGLGEVDGYAGAGATYVAVLAFAKVGFVVNGFRAPLPTANLDLDKPSLVRFWPGRPGFVDWPPLGPPLEPGADLATLLNTAPVRRAAA
jgi:hypothetical protein